MDNLPTFMWLGGDEDGGVTAICDHWSHNGGEQPDNGFAYHAGHGESSARGLPYFRRLSDFVAFIYAHARTH